MNEYYKTQLERFESFKINVLNEDKKQSRLDSVRPILESAIFIFNEIKHSIAQNENIIPTNILTEIATHLDRFNDFTARIDSYNSFADTNNSIASTLNNQLTEWYSTIFSLRDLPHTSQTNTLIILWTYLKTLNTSNIDLIKQEVIDAKNSYNKLKEESEEVLSMLRKEATTETLKDYAEIFKNQSIAHSEFKLFSEKILKLGNAEKWFIAAIILFAGFFYLVTHIQNFFPISIKESGTIVTIAMITRFVIISFYIYILTFVIRQYSVQKHLATLNKHRQNVLNSYHLLISSLSNEDNATKNAIMMEVAKSIYESGQTGYLSTKEAETSSILEITKVVGKGN